MAYSIAIHLDNFIIFWLKNNQFAMTLSKTYLCNSSHRNRHPVASVHSWRFNIQCHCIQRNPTIWHTFHLKVLAFVMQSIFHFTLKDNIQYFTLVLLIIIISFVSRHNLISKCFKFLIKLLLIIIINELAQKLKRIWKAKTMAAPTFCYILEIWQTEQRGIYISVCIKIFGSP